MDTFEKHWRAMLFWKMYFIPSIMAYIQTLGHAALLLLVAEYMIVIVHIVRTSLYSKHLTSSHITFQSNYSRKYLLYHNRSPFRSLRSDPFPNQLQKQCSPCSATFCQQSVSTRAIGEARINWIMLVPFVECFGTPELSVSSFSVWVLDVNDFLQCVHSGTAARTRTIVPMLTGKRQCKASE